MKTELDPRYRAILQTVEDFCLDHENPTIVSKYARYFREGYDAYGLVEEEVHALRDKVLAEHPLTMEEYAEVGWHLFATGRYEFGSVAILLLGTCKDSFDGIAFGWVKKWLDNGVENWAHCDVICSHLTQVFLEKNIVSLDDFIPWRDSESRWTRRAVPVSLLALRKTADPNELLTFIDSMMTDKERVVHQGLGWFLRELWKLHPEPVEEFLFKHKQNCDRLIIQYATEKMKDDKKKRFRKDKPNKPKGSKTYNKKPLKPQKPKKENHE